jgi:hypothetical protein
LSLSAKAETVLPDRLIRFRCYELTFGDIMA